jgi:hypothetical protein
MQIEFKIEDSLDELTGGAAGTEVCDSVSYAGCSVDVATIDSTTSVAKVGEWVQDHSETRKWVIAAADLAAFSKQVLGATVDSALASEISFLHIQAISLPAAANEAVEPCRFDYSINTGSGAVSMGATSTITMSNMTANTITEITLSNLVAVASRKVLLTCTVGLNK